MTTTEARSRRVYLALESIAMGQRRPKRLILWLDDERLIDSLPPTLKRLAARGLTILLCDNVGPHKKYYPYVTSRTLHTVGLVTADDDAFYPRWWLQQLASAVASNAAVISGFRGKEVAISPELELAPYSTWPERSGTEPSFAVMLTGVSGVAYPPEFLNRLRTYADGFRGKCDYADDVWLHYVAVREGFRPRQLRQSPVDFPGVPATQSSALAAVNLRGGNDEQITRTYSKDELILIARDLDVSGTE